MKVDKRRKCEGISVLLVGFVSPLGFALPPSGVSHGYGLRLAREQATQGDARPERLPVADVIEAELAQSRFGLRIVVSDLAACSHIWPFHYMRNLHSGLSGATFDLTESHAT